MIKFYKMYVSSPNEWEEITREELIKFLVGDDYNGYYKDPDIVINALENGFPLRTPFAIYKAEPFYSERFNNEK